MDDAYSCAFVFADYVNILTAANAINMSVRLLG